MTDAYLGLQEQMGWWRESATPWDGHPVYSRLTSQAPKQQAFLYFNQERWIISNKIGLSNGYAYVNDGARRPDAIKRAWHVSTGSAWRQAPEIRSRCAGAPTPAPTTFLYNPDRRIRVSWQKSAVYSQGEGRVLPPSQGEIQGIWVTWACILIGGVVLMVLGWF